MTTRASLLTGSAATLNGLLPAVGGVCPFCLPGMAACPICAVGALPVVGGLATAAVGAIGLDRCRDGCDDGCACQIAHSREA